MHVGWGAVVVVQRVLVSAGVLDPILQLIHDDDLETQARAHTRTNRDTHRTRTRT